MPKVAKCGHFLYKYASQIMEFHIASGLESEKKVAKSGNFTPLGLESEKKMPEIIELHLVGT